MHVYKSLRNGLIALLLKQRRSLEQHSFKSQSDGSIAECRGERAQGWSGPMRWLVEGEHGSRMEILAIVLHTPVRGWLWVPDHYPASPIPPLHPLCRRAREPTPPPPSDIGALEWIWWEVRCCAFTFFSWIMDFREEGDINLNGLSLFLPMFYMLLQYLLIIVRLFWIWQGGSSTDISFEYSFMFLWLNYWIIVLCFIWYNLFWPPNIIFHKVTYFAE